jgi:peptidoglycan/LPS O-acetylase OafA/YrhL
VRINALDVGRGLAILGVVASHAASGSLRNIGGDWSSFVVQIASYGRWGVELFFLISGFIIGSQYEKRWAGSFDFLWARALRILPLWILFTTFWFLVRNELDPAPENPTLLLQTLTFTHWLNRGVDGSLVPGGWSITVEVGCYLIFFMLRERRANSILLSSVLVSSIYLVLGILAKSWNGVSTVSDAIHGLTLHSGYPLFVLGWLLSRAFKFDKKGTLRSKTRLPNLQVNPVVFMLFILTSVLTPVAHGSNVEGLSFVVLASVAAYWLAKKDSSWTTLFAFLGKRSYFIYFFHFVFLFLVPAGFLNSGSLAIEVLDFFLVFVTCVVFSSVFSQLSWIVFEHPILRLRKSLGQHT